MTTAGSSGLADAIKTVALVLMPAEGMGFEPMKGISPYLVSSEALSTTQPTLQNYMHIFYSCGLFCHTHCMHVSKTISQTPMNGIPAYSRCTPFGSFFRFAQKQLKRSCESALALSHLTPSSVRRFRPLSQPSRCVVHSSIFFHTPQHSNSIIDSTIDRLYYSTSIMYHSLPLTLS
jgi:hypothetical protein